MNPYIAQTIARQRQEEIARNARYAYQGHPTPSVARASPGSAGRLIRHLPVAHT